MKKILTLVIIIICVTASYFTSVYFQDLRYEVAYNNNNNTNIYIAGDDYNKNIFSSRESFLNELSKVVNKYNLTINRTTHNSISLNTYTKETIYTNAIESDTFFNNIPLRSGKVFQNQNDTNVFIDTTDTKDNNQIGLIDNFNKNKPVTIRPFMAQEDLPLSVQYSINTTDVNISSKIIDEVKPLIAGGNVWLVNKDYDETSQAKDNTITFYLIMFGLLYAFLIITFIYYLLSRYKEFAITKMFGNTNKTLIFDIVFKDFLKMFIFAEILNVIVTIIGLWLYNSFAEFWNFATYWLLVQTVILVFSLILFVLLSQVVRRIKISNMVKNKKPNRSINIINLLTKVLFAGLVLTVLLSSINGIISITQKNKNLDKWALTKDYVYIRCSVPISSEKGKESKESYLNELLADKKMGDYFEKTNNENKGIFIHPRISSSSQYPEYYPNVNSVYINNNYLKLNPIYDINNEKINIDDEYSEVMTILVPEKYREHEQEIKTLYEKERTFQYNIEEKELNKMIGKENENQQKSMSVKIVYVKDNQSYFTYNPLVNLSTENRINNPIAMVANNVNVDKIEIGNMMINGYYVKYDNLNIDHPMENVKEDLIQTNNFDSMKVYSLYRLVDGYVNDINQKIIKNIFTMIISISVLILIFIISISNYLENRRVINAINKIHGYSFLQRHLRYLLKIPIFWIFIMIIAPIVLRLFGISSLMSNIIIKVFGVIPALDYIYIFTISTIMAIIELIITFIIIKLKEKKITRDVLKGE